ARKKKLAKALLVAALGLACLACGSGESKEPPALAELGYGPADTWQTLPGEFVDSVADAGLRFLVTEHFPAVQGKDWRKGELLDSFPEQARAWNKRACERGMVHVVFLGNWNVLPLRKQSDQWWAEKVLNEALSLY